ncbi:uncharacterized protein LOC105188144 [Harpegnathos saltator]|uniref:uncharacterized protein LOC105188144 n=1 Tax=Harpegnathos saltator TaxID=610380 RepID=UPI00058AD665|nr:uncharacterized protein LOC105188144 [Harpegnathos saltator]
MVLIIRNCRILSSRHRKQARKGELKDRERSCHSRNIDHIKNDKSMGLVMVLGTLLLYSTAMFTLPFVAFYGVRHYIRLEFQTDTFVTNCISVFAAVVTVNLIISCYAYQALHETAEEEENNTKEEVVESEENLIKKSL